MLSGDHCGVHRASSSVIHQCFSFTWANITQPSSSASSSFERYHKVHDCISQRATATNENERRRDSSLTASVVLQLKILPSPFYFATDILLWAKKVICAQKHISDTRVWNIWEEVGRSWPCVASKGLYIFKKKKKNLVSDLLPLAAQGKVTAQSCRVFLRPKMTQRVVEKVSASGMLSSCFWQSLFFTTTLGASCFFSNISTTKKMEWNDMSKKILQC